MNEEKTLEEQIEEFFDVEDMDDPFDQLGKPTLWQRFLSAMGFTK